jgi:small-conductance mechanosensitive channel
MSLVCSAGAISNGFSQEETGVDTIEISENAQITIPQTIEDTNIEKRLRDIMTIAPWYENVSIDVRQGVVVLKGEIDHFEHKDWLIEVLKKTEGVIAWVDQMNIQKATIDDLKPDFDAFSSIINKFKNHVPYILIALIVLVLTLAFAFIVDKIVDKILSTRLESQLIVDAVAKLSTVPILILGFYAVLRSTGLTGLATTLIGGTSIIGLVVGLSLKGFFENYFASLTIRFKNIFRKGDFIEVDGVKGIVQNVNTRGTTLMDFEGNHITVPNSKIFSGIVKNYVTNPNRRGDFIVGIDYEEDVNQVRQYILDALKGLENVILSNPQPYVLIDSLGAATVNVKVYFWCNSNQNSLFKVKSLVMQTVKEKLMAEQVSMPDDAREIIVPKPIQIQNIDTVAPESKAVQRSKPISPSPLAMDITSDIQDIKKQMDENPLPEERDGPSV